MDINRHIDIMGIVNLTDDSYFAQSRCGEVSAALKRIETLVDEGATVIDLGACSTRPGSLPVGAEEEWRRLKPVLEAVAAARSGICLSIDTCWSDVVRKSYDLIGDFIVNDISSGEDDPAMLPLVGRLGLRYVAMHKRGTPQTMQSLTDYKDVVGDVLTYFNSFAHKAFENGIKDWILDPGFGFAKTIGQNYNLLSRLSDFKKAFPASKNGEHDSYIIPKILVGVSRKSMVYRLFDITPEESLPATQVLHLAALQNGADILRVHDVAEALRTLAIYRRLV